MEAEAGEMGRERRKPASRGVGQMWPEPVLGPAGCHVERKPHGASTVTHSLLGATHVDWVRTGDLRGDTCQGPLLSSGLGVPPSRARE